MASSLVERLEDEESECLAWAKTLTYRAGTQTDLADGQLGLRSRAEQKGVSDGCGKRTDG